MQTKRDQERLLGPRGTKKATFTETRELAIPIITIKQKNTEIDPAHILETVEMLVLSDSPTVMDRMPRDRETTGQWKDTIVTKTTETADMLKEENVEVTHGMLAGEMIGIALIDAKSLLIWNTAAFMVPIWIQILIPMTRWK